jgi:hypothetical protein
MRDLWNAWKTMIETQACWNEDDLKRLKLI